MSQRRARGQNHPIQESHSGRYTSPKVAQRPSKLLLIPMLILESGRSSVPSEANQSKRLGRVRFLHVRLGSLIFSFSILPCVSPTSDCRLNTTVRCLGNDTVLGRSTDCSTAKRRRSSAV